VDDVCTVLGVDCVCVFELVIEAESDSEGDLDAPGVNVGAVVEEGVGAASCVGGVFGAEESEIF
jgi:hypothetical protein